MDMGSTASNSILESERNAYSITGPDLLQSTKQTIIKADSLLYGLDGCILPGHKERLGPIPLCSRTLSSTKLRYGQIEKECLAVVWTCECLDTWWNRRALHSTVITTHSFHSSIPSNWYATGQLLCIDQERHYTRYFVMVSYCHQRKRNSESST